MQEGKNHRHDGLTIEFYLGLFDLLNDDLLEVIKEYKQSIKILGSLNATHLALIPKKLVDCSSFQ